MATATSAITAATAAATTTTTTTTTIDNTHELCGAWESTEAFGNTSLDWSQALKDRSAWLAVTFTPDGTYDFVLFTRDAKDEDKPDDNDGEGGSHASERVDVTARFRHVVASKGRYELRGTKGLVIIGASVGCIHA